METYLLETIRMSFCLNLKPDRFKLSKRSNLPFFTGTDIGRISNQLDYDHRAFVVFLNAKSFNPSLNRGLYIVNLAWE